MQIYLRRNYSVFDEQFFFESTVLVWDLETDIERTHLYQLLYAIGKWQGPQDYDGNRGLAWPFAHNNVTDPNKLFSFFWLKIVIFMPLIFKMKEWKYSCIVLQDEIIYYDFLRGFGHSFSVVQGTNLLHVPFIELSFALNIGYS